MLFGLSGPAAMRPPAGGQENVKFGNEGTLMNEDQLQSPRQSQFRAVLRIGGLIAFGLGSVFMIVGVGSFIAAFGNSGPPRYFWCAFVGMPLMFVGGTMTMFGFLGAFGRFVAGESAPVAKDVINYMGENIQPGVKAVTKAMAEGVIEAQKEQQTPGRGPA